jgi:hypothetical protein
MPHNWQQQHENPAPLLYYHCPPGVQVFWHGCWVSAHLYLTLLRDQIWEMKYSSYLFLPIMLSRFLPLWTAVLPWLLESAPIPLSYCYQSVVVNLRFVCDSHGDYHIHPLDTHLAIATVCWNFMLHYFYPLTVWLNALDAVKGYMPIKWGNRIHYAGSLHFLLDAYNFIKRNIRYGYLYFTNGCWNK